MTPQQIRERVNRILTEILQAPPSKTATLVAQGLDSLDAETLIEALQELGLDVDYEFLLADATFDSLLDVLRVSDESDLDPELANQPEMGTFPLTGTQSIWAELESAGWQDWANISLCLSIPEKLVPAAWLPAMLQALCDSNEALRMVLVAPNALNSLPQQRALSKFQLPIDMRIAPADERSVMREIEAFEGKVVSPYTPSTRAMILSASNGQEFHWICLSMHHVFSDRISMQNLERQFKELLLEGRLKADPVGEVAFAQYARAQSNLADDPDSRENQDRLGKLLEGADIGVDRPVPQLSSALGLSLGDLPTTGYLQHTEAHALEACAKTLETTVPLLLHAIFNALAMRLTLDPGLDRDGYPLLCHVISNRHQISGLKKTVGCLDTSVPVAPSLGLRDTLKTYCARTRHAFTEATKLIHNTPRGSWLKAHEAVPKGPALFERVPHINIVRRPQDDASELAELGVREHPVRRSQRTRWGLLLRVALPLSQKHQTRSDTEKSQETGMLLTAYSEDRDLATAAHFCLTRCLRILIALTPSELEKVCVHGLIDDVLDEARFASEQVAKAAALVADEPSSQPFTYERLIARQRRWYAHDDQLKLLRDDDGRFVGNAANPFPFTQLDKLKERAYLQELDVPMAKLLHVLPKAGLAETLPRIATDLPDRFVLKPVGAGHSFGVTVVRDGLDLTRNGSPFDVQRVTAELVAMAKRGSCIHEGKTFPFNFSSFLIEELVEDSCGFATPTDYKVFMIGRELLWIQLHFKHDGHTWVAFLDEQFRLLPQPAWDPHTCWRTHRALVCTDQAMADAHHPSCLPDILAESRRLANHMGIFVRLDWYADATHGPLMGEITTFPHMLQPRTFYSAWANERVRNFWQEPDGVAAPTKHGDAVVNRIQAIVKTAQDQPIGITAFLPEQDQRLWAKGDNISFAYLRRYLHAFDLTPWGVPAGGRVALILPNGTAYAGTLLAIMNRYVAVPLKTGTPAEFLTAQFQSLKLDAVIVLANSEDSFQAQLAAKHVPNTRIVELVTKPNQSLPELAGKPTEGSANSAPLRRVAEGVLVLQTSGTTGAPKTVIYTLEKLMRAGASIAQSLDLSSQDTGLSVLPLHHVGGITCNLIAPMLSCAAMRFLPGFDPRRFFEEMEGANGISWSYLVPTLWSQVLSYAADHAELAQNKPWPQLRAIRSAGADLPHDIAKDLSTLFGDAVHILPTYGMTEAMPIAAPPPSYRLERPGTVGIVRPDIDVEIVEVSQDAPDTVLIPGETGEITVRGSTVFDGYEPEDGAQDDPFTKRGFFRTGDLGQLAADGSGWLTVKGRLKEAINRGGETISPLEIETALRGFPGWKDIATPHDILVFPRKHSLLGEDVALAVTGELKDVDLHALHTWAATQLPPNMLPKTLVFMPNLPVSASGKPLRMQVSQDLNAHLAPAETGELETYDWGQDGLSLRSRIANATNLLPPSISSDTVSIDSVIEVIRPFLHTDVPIAADTHLGDAGVNSLAALEVVLALNERFNCDLPTWAVSDHPTPGALLAQLDLQAKPEHRPVPVAPQTPKQSNVSNRVRRVLFLHGEASDAELAELSLRATLWIDGLRDRIEFVFMNGPHACAPKPNFHEAAVVAGHYKKPMYRSWGGMDAKRLDESLTTISKRMSDLGPIDGIAGVCDGALVAALVAAKHPELDVCFNFASGPASESAAQNEWHIDIPTLHLISPQDTLHSLSQLMEVPARCNRAIIFQHAFGHAIPQMKGTLKAEIESALDLIFETAPQESRAQHHLWDRDKTTDDLSVANKLSPQILTEPTDANRETKACVKQAMAQILGHNDFGNTDDFFDLGGNSLSAMELSLSLESMLGTKIPLEVFGLEHSSVDRLAQAIDYHSKNRPPVALVPMNASQARPVVYALPTLGGHLSDYLAFSQAIAPYAQFVGIRYDKLLSTSSNTRVTLNEIAQGALDLIRQQPAEGTIYLVGFSIAGIFAYETARALAESGQPVTLLLIDAEPQVETNWRSELAQVVKQLPLPWARKLTTRQMRNPDLRDVNHALRQQLCQWQPSPFAIDTILFCAEAGLITPSHITIWTKAVGGQIVSKSIQGGHTGIWSAETAKDIAEKLATELNWPAT